MKNVLTAMIITGTVMLLSYESMAQCCGSKSSLKPKAEAKAIKPQTTCPVMGGKITKLYVDAGGKRIYVCCKGCIPKIQKDPQKYIKKIEAKGETPEVAPQKKTETRKE